MTDIRPAQPADTAQIAAIWNHYIEHTVVTFTDALKTAAELNTLLNTKAAADEPFLVAAQGTDIIGFATYGAFRNGPGYAQVKEHTVMLAPDAAKGLGHGRALMTALLDHAKSHCIHSIFAGICADNTDAVAFHTALGFEQAARLNAVGYKFQKRHDLILMQKLL